AALEAAEARDRRFELGPCLGPAPGATERLREQQRDLLGAKARVGLANEREMRDRFVETLAGEVRARRAEADLEVSGERALQAGVVVLRGLERLAGFEQRTGQSHLVLRRRR